MPNRENRGYNGIDVLEKGFSGQHNRQEVRQLRPSGRIDRRISLAGNFMVGKKRIEMPTTEFSAIRFCFFYLQTNDFEKS